MSAPVRLVAGALIALAVLVAFAGGCADSGGGEKTVTVEKPAAEAPPAEEDPSEPGERPRKKKRRSTAGGSGGSGGSITVPNVQGKNHQLAQDTMQAAGLYNLVEEDCSGQGRALILDRNWQVQKQSPAPDTRVTADKAITLCSQKIGE
jgi:hypothetical protein